MGAVLSIFPYVNWVGMLLGYRAADRVVAHLGRTGGPGSR